MGIPRHDKGDIIRVTGMFTDSAGIATNPDSVWLMLSIPHSGDVASHDVSTKGFGTAADSIVNPTTGDFFHDITADLPGIYSFRWLGRGAAAAAETGQFIIEEFPA